MPTVKCSWCNKLFHIRLSYVTRSKSKIFYCSQKCHGKDCSMFVLERIYHKPLYDILYYDYIELELSTVEIGKKYSFHNSAVSSNLKKLNIPIRKPAELVSGNRNPMFGMKGNKHHNYGKRLSDEEKQKMSKLRKQEFKNGKRKVTKYWVGKKHTNEYKKMMSNRTKGRIFTEEHLKNLRIAGKKKNCDPEYRKMMAIAAHRKPNKPEEVMIKLIKKYNLPYKYTGDARCIIENRCPDFMNCNGEKKVIEIFGDYWHNPEKNKKIRPDMLYDNVIADYEKYGFKCLIIWEHEVYNEQIAIERLMEFSNYK